MAQEFDEQGRGYWVCPGMDTQGGSEGDSNPHEIRNEATKADANLVSSLCRDGHHRPVIDIDIPARYVPSSTPGHGHLYIDVPMSWETYRALLIALEAAGVIQGGFLRGAIERGATFVRPPWVKKPGAGA